MGLDAVVYCDCYEKGGLRVPPPPGVSLRVGWDGSLERESDPGSLEADLAFDQWRQSACEHEDGVLLHHRLGNITLIGYLRSELQREEERFPILLARVLYSGTHSGDYLDPDIIPALQKEIGGLSGFKCGTQETTGLMSEFRAQMSALAAAALSAGKPVVF